MTNPIEHYTREQEQKMREFKYEVTTNILEYGKIEQYVEFGGFDVRQRVMVNVINTKDSQVKEALARLGWTPPKANHISSATGTGKKEQGAPRDHYTLEQVEQMVKLNFNWWEVSETLIRQSHTMLNAAINGLIGEPELYMAKNLHNKSYATSHSEAEAKLFLLQSGLKVDGVESSVLPLYTLENSQ